jgi:hypothetical protein
MNTNVRDRLASIFYWVGVVATLGSISLVLLGNTKWGAQVQHTSFPLAWKFAIVAVVAFLAGEVSRPAQKLDGKLDSGHSLEHTPYEI